MTSRIAAITLALTMGALQPGPSHAQGPTPTPDTRPDWVREEDRTRAREDIANLDAYVKAKAARLREADLRLALVQERQAGLVRQKSKGMVSGLTHYQGEVAVAEIEAERETRAAELKEVETRRDRAKRRLALIDRGIRPDPPSTKPLLSDHRELDRMRTELDDVKRRLRLNQIDP